MRPSAVCKRALLLTSGTGLLHVYRPLLPIEAWTPPLLHPRADALLPFFVLRAVTFCETQISPPLLPLHRGRAQTSLLKRQVEGRTTSAYAGPGGLIGSQ